MASVSMSMIYAMVLLYTLCSESNQLRLKRQTASCSFRGRRYQPGQRWTFQISSKTFACTCTSSGTPSCEWQTATNVVQRRCYERAARRYRDEGEDWEIMRSERTLDCTCELNERNRRMQISCTGENRCHHHGQSYRRGDDWQASDATGLVMDCQCLGPERISCRASVTTAVPRPKVDAQWVKDHIVYGKQVLRPRIATLQACDTGTRVVSSGYTWNQTGQVRENDYTVKKCQCRDALIQCEPFQVSRSSEPHCLTVDGQIKLVGQYWTREHHSYANIRYRCNCKRHGKRECRDIGYCPEPSPPPNGGLVCVASGNVGADQTHYCKPLCTQGFDFLNRRRYYRIWEVCSKVTNHRWSGGYADDALLVGKCRRTSSTRRGRSSLYLPTTDCQTLTNRQIQQIKINFIRSLKRQGLCSSKCEANWLGCGSSE